MRCSLLSVTHPPLHMVKLQEPILQLICLTRVIHFALSTFPSRVWVPCPCKLSQLVSQPSSILFPVNVRILSALISLKRAEPHHDQLPTLPSLRAKDEIQDHRRQVDTRYWFLYNKEGFQMVNVELKTGILM